jgi:hypothetical protein
VVLLVVQLHDVCRGHGEWCDQYSHRGTSG